MKSFLLKSALVCGLAFQGAFAADEAGSATGFSRIDGDSLVIDKVTVTDAPFIIRLVAEE